MPVTTSPSKADALARTGIKPLYTYSLTRRCVGHHAIYRACYRLYSASRSTNSVVVNG